MHLFNT